MCFVSYVGDSYGEKFPKKYPWLDGMQQASGTSTAGGFVYGVTRTEFEALRDDVKEMKEILISAKLYDESNAEEPCFKEEKVELLRRIAELVGVDLEDLLE